MGKDVFISPQAGKWLVRKQGNARATAITETKKVAEEIGRRAAREERSVLTITGKDGKLQSVTNYGDK